MIRFLKATLAAVVLAFSATALADAGDAVNVNTADAATMARVLTGVGESRARAIVEYREEHGQFVDVYELANVKGIGERTVELNADRIRLED